MHAYTKTHTHINKMYNIVIISFYFSHQTFIFKISFQLKFLQNDNKYFLRILKISVHGFNLISNQFVGAPLQLLKFYIAKIRLKFLEVNCLKKLYCNIEKAGKPYRRGRISTDDLLVVTRSDQQLFIAKLYFTFFTKQPILMRRSTVLSLPLQ
jgi:hypothetical protein